MKTLDIGMKRIESKEDMLKWATAVNQGLWNMDTYRCDFQDIYAHSQQKDLEHFFCELNGNRPLVACSVNNVMGWDGLEQLVRALSAHKANKIINEEMDRWEKDFAIRTQNIQKRELSLKECLKGYWKRISALRRDNLHLHFHNANLQKTNDRLLQDRREALAKVQELREKANKYDSLKSLLS